MAARIQNKILGLGVDAQASITQPSQTFLRWRQLNAELAPSGFLTENDAAEIGKGNEFISDQGVYPVSYNPLARIDKYASAEFITWGFAFAMGSVDEVAGVYTITPLDPCTNGLEMPYFSVVEQVCEGGATCLDNMFVGCAVEDVEYAFNYGPGRQSGRVTLNWVGSGTMVTPSGVLIPTVLTEHYLLSASMQLVINGVDYVQAATMLSGTIGWKNNLLVGPGFFPGSGMQNGAAVRGRLEMGARASTFTFTARLLKNSQEYQMLVDPSLGTGTATVSAFFNPTDATHNYATFTYPAIQYETVVNGEQDGIVSVTVTVATKVDASNNGPLTVTTGCGISGIAQPAGGKVAAANGNSQSSQPIPPPPFAQPDQPQPGA